jgi:non-canonical purine NTP pyrophosphatase (RdgB/HAM1 family)
MNTLFKQKDQKIQEFLFASSNSNKIKELKLLCAENRLSIKIPKDLEAGGVLSPEEPEESIYSYYDNARLKSETYFDWSGLPTLADDSGIEVDALGGKPGVTSARFAGKGSSAYSCNVKLLKELDKETNRKALFRSVLCLMLDHGVFIFVEATISGKISKSLRGNSGWGYEPLFILDGYEKTLSEMRDEEIKFDSHRGLAFKKLFKILT